MTLHKRRTVAIFGEGEVIHIQTTECAYQISTNPFGLAKRCLLGDGMIVPADEFDDAEEESSS